MCSLSSDGAFHVGVLRRRIEDSGSTPSIGVIDWIYEVLVKLNCFGWRANLGCILVLVELEARGLLNGSNICGDCLTEVELADHVLVKCSFTKEIWSKVLAWRVLPKPSLNKVSDIVSFAAKSCHYFEKRRNLISICYGSLWWIWKSRCDRIFKRNGVPSDTVVDIIKSDVFTWLKLRGDKRSYVWAEWCSCTFSYL